MKKKVLTTSCLFLLISSQAHAANFHITALIVSALAIFGNVLGLQQPGMDVGEFNPFAYSEVVQGISIDRTVDTSVTRRDLSFDYNPSGVFLPQDDPYPANRTADLQALQAIFKNGPVSHSFDGVSTPLYIGRGLSVTPGPVLNQVLKEIADVVSHETFNSSAIIAEALQNSPTDTLPEIEKLYDVLVTKGYPRPSSLEKLNSDAYAADVRLTFSGHDLKLLKKPLFYLGLSNAQRTELLGKGKNLNNIQLYGIDYSDLDQYKATDGRPQYIPSVQAMFAENAQGVFVLIAVKLIQTGLVYTRFDSIEEWRLARRALNTAEMFVTSASHFRKTHGLVGPIRTEVIRHLHERHPLYKLLAHHLRNADGLGVYGLKALFSKNTLLDALSGGAQMYMKWYNNHTELAEDFSATFAADMKQRGLQGLEHNRQATDKGRLLNIVREFVGGYLTISYGGKTLRNENILADQELQNWAAACASDTGGGLKNFPATITSYAQLRDILTHILYLVLIEHPAMNSNALWHANALPSTSFAFWAPLPTEKGVSINPRSYLAPLKSLLVGQIILSEKFLRKVTPQESIYGTYDNSGLSEDPAFKDIYQKFKTSLYNEHKRIEKREKQRDNANDGVYFDTLDPLNVPDWFSI